MWLIIIYPYLSSQHWGEHYFCLNPKNSAETQMGWGTPTMLHCWLQTLHQFISLSHFCEKNAFCECIYFYSVLIDGLVWSTNHTKYFYNTCHICPFTHTYNRRGYHREHLWSDFSSLYRGPSDFWWFCVNACISNDGHCLIMKGSQLDVSSVSAALLPWLTTVLSALNSVVLSTLTFLICCNCFCFIIILL